MAPARMVALLRGVNVGRKRVAMVDLRRLVSTLGYTDVTTLLNSGNVVFSVSRGTPDHIGARLQEAVRKTLCVDCRVLVFDVPEFTRIVKGNTLRTEAETDPSRLLVAFWRSEEARQRVLPLAKLPWGRETLVVGRHAAYLWCADGILSGTLADAVTKAFGDDATTRNWATVQKIGGTGLFSTETGKPGTGLGQMSS